MVSGLEVSSYEKLRELGLTTLEERSHQADMWEIFKIATRKDNVDRESWFKMASEAPVMTRQAAGPLNIVKSRSSLNVRANYFSVRAVERWNNIPPVDTKNGQNSGTVHEAV
jgi:hypothetical protein